MNTGRQRMSARDYKNARRSQPVFDFARYRQFGAGLAVGLVATLFVWIHDHQGQSPPADEAPEVTGPAVTEEPAEPDAEDPDAALDYPFYAVLPNFEVEVPEPAKGRKRSDPVREVTVPGAYVLQTGMYLNLAGAELMRDKLARLDIDATILHVSDDTVEKHFVHIGPLRDLARLNAMLKTLHSADIPVFVQRAGD